MPKKVVKKKGSVKVTKQVVKNVICGHEEVAHPESCHAEGVDCDKMYFRCGGHGEHFEKECQKLCV